MCLAKKKTKVVKKTLDPTYQQALLFDESPQGKVLQVTGLWFSDFLLFTTQPDEKTKFIMLKKNSRCVCHHFKAEYLKLSL